MTRNAQDPLFQPEQQGMWVRILPPLVLICAFGGFIALAIYAYQTGGRAVDEGELMVVEADKTPLKEKPTDPGGMQFPNQDKTVFETFSAGSQPEAKVERMLPTPEEPIEADVHVATSATPATPAAPVAGMEQIFGNETEEVRAVASAPAVAPEATDAKMDSKVVNVREELGKQAVQEAAPVEGVVVATSQPVELAPVMQPQAEKAAAKPIENNVKKSVEKPSKPITEVVTKKPVTVKSLVQLGAYKSEADAKADFIKMLKKHAALAGKSPVVNRADLGEKGVFYRLRVGVEDAKSFCQKLTAAGQACVVVR